MFTCAVSGTPTPSIAWYHNGLPLASSGGVIVAGSVVTIASALVENSGMYQCFANNEFSNVFKSWTLQVREPGIHVYVSVCVCVLVRVHVCAWGVVSQCACMHVYVRMCLCVCACACNSVFMYAYYIQCTFILREQSIV